MLHLSKRREHAQREKQMSKTPKATVRLNAWELVAIQEALQSLTYIEPISKAALIAKIANAKLK